MGSDKFSLHIILRTFLLFISCYALAWVMVHHPDRLLILNLVVIIMLQIVFFIRVQKKRWQQTDTILSFLEHSTEQGITLDTYRGEISESLVNRLQQIEDRFSSLRLDMETQNHFLQTMIDNIQVGVMAYDPEGRIKLLNKTALELIGIKTLKNLDQLQTFHPRLYESIRHLSQKQPVLYRLNYEGIPVTISLKTGQYRFLNQDLYILTMHPIQQELDEQEIDSWQKLIRVLTHEIMNSTGPISSTLDTLIEIYTDKATGMPRDRSTLSNSMLDDLVKGLHIIKGRSDGLARFVKHYRSMTLVPVPVMQPVHILKIFEQVYFLFQQTIIKKNAKVKMHVIPEGLIINADPDLLEQVLINLVKNALEAMADTELPILQLIATRQPDKQVLIEVMDNGIGIPNELQDKILVPFFTTKEEGSGIGLSVSRQIIHRHGGTLSFISEENKGTTFRIII